MITFSDESSFGKDSETPTDGLVDVDTEADGRLEETRLMVLVVDSEIVVASFTSNISSDLTEFVF